MTTAVKIRLINHVKGHVCCKRAIPLHDLSVFNEIIDVPTYWQIDSFCRCLFSDTVETHLRSMVNISWLVGFCNYCEIIKYSNLVRTLTTQFHTSFKAPWLQNNLTINDKYCIYCIYDNSWLFVTQTITWTLYIAVFRVIQNQSFFELFRSDSYQFK